MSIVTRPASPDDVPRIATLLGQLGYPSTTDAVAHRLTFSLGDPLSELIVAEVEHTVAGVAAVHAIPRLEDSMHLGRLTVLVVDDGFRRRGVGRALVAAAEERAVALGCRDMEVTSSRVRTSAHGFYTSLGYDDTCSRKARFLKDLSQTEHHRADDPAG
jgi:GNAT superfamily N-acetyltransferase